MDTKEITFVIVTFYSENVIYDCLDLLPKDSKKVIIENSKNLKLKISLEKKYSNLKCYLMDENLGYGKANNVGINFSQTEFVFILNPDVRFKSSDINKFLKILSGENFVIAAPIENEELNTLSNQKKFEEVDYVKGFAMLLNKKYLNNEYFDENFFLYLEEIDLCKRLKLLNKKIYISKNIFVKHLAGKSHDPTYSEKMEIQRNWHYMWSLFYFNKKHYGLFKAYSLTIGKFISAYFKSNFYFFINKKKYLIYKHRFLGLLNSYLNKKSSFRI